MPAGPALAGAHAEQDVATGAGDAYDVELAVAEAKRTFQRHREELGDGTARAMSQELHQVSLADQRSLDYQPQDAQASGFQLADLISSGAHVHHPGQHDPTPTSPKLDTYPMEAFEDYIDTVVRRVKNQRLSNSFFGYLCFLLVILVVVLQGTSAVYDLRTASYGLGRQTGTLSSHMGDVEWPGQKLQNLDDFWTWVQFDLLPSYYKQHWYKTYSDSSGTVRSTISCEASDTLCKQRFARYNLIVGSMRMTTQRITPNTYCSIPSNLQRTGLSCYPIYSSNSKSKSWSGYTYQSSTDVASWWSKLPGHWMVYEDNGFVYDWVPGMSTTEYTDALNTLKTNLFADYSTRSISFTINTYNPGLAQWAQNTITFEATAAGVLFYRSFTQSFEIAESTFEVMTLWILAWGSLHYLINAIFLTSKEVSRYLEFKQWAQDQDTDASSAEAEDPVGCLAKFQRCIGWTRTVIRQFLNFWTMWRMIDALQAGCMLGWLYYRVSYDAAVVDFNPDMASTAYLHSINSVTSPAATATMLQGPVFFLVLLKALRYMGMNPRLLIIPRSLQLCAKDMSSFLLSFTLLFIGFTFWSHVAFFSTVPEVATVVDSINANIEYLMGNISLNSFYEAHVIMGPLFAGIFVFIMAITISNMFIAIVGAGYEAAIAEYNLPTPFAEDHRTVSQKQLKDGLLSLMSYLKKICLVFSFNLFFQSPTGLGVPSEAWSALSFGGRVKAVLRDNGLWLFKAILLFQLPPVVDQDPDSSASIFRTHQALSAALRRVRKKVYRASMCDDDSQHQFFVSSEAITALTDNMEDFQRCYDQWNGPSSQRVPHTSVEHSINTSFAILTHGMWEIRSKLRNASVGSQLKQGTHSHLSEYRRRQEERSAHTAAPPHLQHMVTLADFPGFVHVKNVDHAIRMFSRDVPRAFQC